MKNALKTGSLLGVALLLAAGPSYAQYAPTPKKAPSTPVSKEALAGKNAPAIPDSRLLEGLATVVDSEHLRINGIEVRLFGVVPPQMGASYGPQARAVIDSLAQGSVTCQIRDREKTGGYLASCSNGSNADFGLELLRRGLAVAARGSLRSSDYQAPYLAAEQAAQTQKLGLWSNAIPTAASEKSIREAAQKAEADKIEAEKAKKEEQARLEKEKAEAEAKAQTAAEAAAKKEAEKKAAEAKPVEISLATGTVKPPLPQLKPDASIDAAAGLTADDLQPLLLGAGQPALAPVAPPMNFFERYQLLLSTLIALGTAVTISLSVFLLRARQSKEELRATAAALRGELMAARSVCQARLSKIAHDGTAAGTSWPRIRTLVFQAYVGRLGCLGSELSRQIASIYGMAADYASYYNTTEARSEDASKQRALEALIRHIEEVTPRLAQIEESGKIPPAPKAVAFTSVLPSPGSKPIHLTSSYDTPPDGPGKPMGSTPVLQADEKHKSTFDITADISKAKAEIVAEPVSHLRARIAAARQRQQQITASKGKPQQSATTSKASVQKTVTPAPDAKKKTAPVALYLRQTATKQQQALTKTASKLHDAAQTALQSVTTLNLKAPILEKLAEMKSKAASRAKIEEPLPLDPVLADYTIPDYANLSEEELEALLYAEDELYMNAPCGPVKSRRAG